MTNLKESALCQLIMSRLNENTVTSGQTIDVVVTDGDIYLLGWCDTMEQKLRAELIVRGTYGAKSVIDRIRVRAIAHGI